MHPDRQLKTSNGIEEIGKEKRKEDLIVQSIVRGISSEGAQQVYTPE